MLPSSTMPATSNSAGAKKPRKKPRPPQQISEETWLAIEKSVLAGGGYSEVGRRFNVSAHAIMARCRRHGWAVPSRIAERTAALQARSKACERDRNGNEEVIEVVAQSWAEKGEQHRHLAFDLGHTLRSKRLPKQACQSKTGQRPTVADTHGPTRSAGLDSEENTRINIGLEFINVRLEKTLIEMPKDLPEGDPSSLEYGPPVKQLQPPRVTKDGL